MKLGIAGKTAQAFIKSKLTVLLIIASLAIGAFSVYLTPSEEEPQIIVPMADIFVMHNGASPEEVESRISQPLEKIISNIHGVEYVYSTSMPNMAMLIVRFYVGEDAEESIVKLYNEIMRNMDKMPQGISMPFVKTKSIDDVPIMSLALWSKNYDDYDLRRVGNELANEVKKITDVGDINVIGGRKRKINVMLDRNKMASYNVDPLMVMMQVKGANKQSMSGSFNYNNKEFLVETGNFFETVDDVKNLVVGVFHGSPVYLKNVAEVTDGPEEPKNYTAYGYGAVELKENSLKSGVEFPAVTISVAKRKGADAKQIAESVLSKVEMLKGDLIPSDVKIEVTRNYGDTASEKVNDLLLNLLGSILAASIVVAIFLGWRGGWVVFASVPITFALTLFVYYMMGYTLNRITLFALVFVTGIVVDASIIVVENMHRHFKMKKLPRYQAALTSIDEVGNPTILATFTVIASVLPMAFVSGLMGPYMAPMPIGAALAMMFSLLVALVVTPYVAYKSLGEEKPKKDEKKYVLQETLIYKYYVKTMMPLIESARKRWIVIISVTVLLLLSISLLFFKMVTVKMLPFDNKNEIQIIIDMPEGTTLEQTAVVTKEIAGYLRTVPEVVNYQNYVGTAAPINFNGLVRHYDLRRGSNVADIQINLLDKSERSDQSHDIAKRIRPHIQKIAEKFNANVKVAEVPPGPPVMSTIVAEVYGPDRESQLEYAKKLKGLFESTKGVVDIDWLVEDDQVEYKFEIDKKKAMLSGISAEQIVGVLGISLYGSDVSAIYQPNEVEPVTIQLRLPESDRSNLNDIRNIKVMSPSGKLVAVGDLVNIKEQIQDKSIYRKNQKRAVYVTADVAGELESPVYAILDLDKKIQELNEKEGLNVEQFYTAQPESESEISVKWDGEWHITYEVFRDLGAAFAVVLVIIYMLIIGWFQSFKVPIVMMIAIPLSLIGVLVGHLIFGAFFTATSMIGVIALAGIMVRNSVLLIDFIDLRLAEGIEFKQAVLESGAVRTLPILLTAGTVVIGAFVIIFDPIFEGLAISLMGGAVASTALTLIMVPLVYYMTERKKYEVEDQNTEVEAIKTDEKTPELNNDEETN
ncbi:MAG: efflux RND transporter permease subunit [Ignavibacteriae bacterium]|nr:efflux RND transporter permease subunit [Ignavibacteriota bacterium]NOG99313.1 efflux RND transporter permease subunit [Ignavibacteriota bacterium]